MALATQCPHCGTVFRVAADQLKLRGGIVRCGACQLIFDGNAGLVDLTKTAAPPLPASSPVSSPSAAPAPDAPAQASAASADPIAHDEPASADQSAADAASGDQQPVYTLELDRTFAPHGILPQAAASEDAGGGSDTALLERTVDDAPEAEPAPADDQGDPEVAPEAGPDPEPEPESESEPAAAPERADDAPPLLLRESAGGSPPIAPPPPVTPRARAAEARARRSKLTPTRIEESPKLRAPDSDEPEFVRRGRQREQSGKARRIALALGSLVLLLALGAQAVHSLRDVLAARYPALRPTLVSSCALLGCSIKLPTRPDQLVIETGELITLGGNAYTFSTLLRNQGDMALA